MQCRKTRVIPVPLPRISSSDDCSVAKSCLESRVTIGIASSGRRGSPGDRASARVIACRSGVPYRESDLLRILTDAEEREPSLGWLSKFRREKDGSVNFVSRRSGRGTLDALRLLEDSSRRIRVTPFPKDPDSRARSSAVFAYTHTCATRRPKIRGMRFPLIPRRAANPHADSASGRHGVATIRVCCYHCV